MNSKLGKMGRHIVSVLLLVTAFFTLATGCSKTAGIEEKSSQTINCANQLKMLEGAKQLWAQQGNKTTNDTPAMSDLAPFLRWPGSCPGGGTYTLGKVGELPACSIPEHQAAFVKLMQAPPAQTP